MRRGLIDQLMEFLRSLMRENSRRSTPRSKKGTGPVTIEYSPSMDGDPDPGEVVWTWVSYEDDPTQGKDRPVVIIGRRGDHLAGIALTSKKRNDEPQVAVGSGPWDREGRTSFARVDRVLNIDPNQVRREGAVLQRRHFDKVVAGVRKAARP